MNIRFRRAQEEDINSINALFAEMLCSVYPSKEVQADSAGEWERFFTGGEDWVCVAEVDGRIVAFLSIEVHREQQTYLYYDDFCVTHSFRNRGIGSMLMQEAEKYARLIGVSTIVLHVEKSNTAARRLYERKGFTMFRDDGTRLCMLQRLA